MSPANAVELAYLIQEHGRCSRLLEAIKEATDCTIMGDAQLTFSTSGVPVLIPLPHMLVRSMFGSGALTKVVTDYRNSLDARLEEEFGIIIEAPPAIRLDQKGSGVE